MIDVMSGKISTGAISNLLEYFKQIRAEGRLKLEANSQVGQIYLEDGSVIHSVWRDLIGQAALRELLSWRDGRFEFEPDVLSPVQSIVPEMSPVVAASASGGFSAVMSSQVQESSVMVAEPPSMTSASAASLMAEEPHVPFALPATLPEELLEELTLLVKRLMGPIGGIFLDDAVEDLGYGDADAIPVENAQELIQTMADYFDNDARRRQFLETAKELLRRNGIEENEK